MDLEILKIASNTENSKALKNYTHFAKGKNPICGDTMDIEIIIKSNQIVDFGYRCKSCIYCQASASLLSVNSVNKKIEKINDLINFAENFFQKKNSSFEKEWMAFNKLFNKKNVSRKDCILLPFKTLSKALRSK